MRALGDFERDAALSDNERLALRYAAGMTQTPVEVSGELFQQLEQVYDRRQLVELTSCIAWQNYRARFDHAFGIEADGFSEGSYCPIPEHARLRD